MFLANSYNPSSSITLIMITPDYGHLEPDLWFRGNIGKLGITIVRPLFIVGCSGSRNRIIVLDQTKVVGPVLSFCSLSRFKNKLDLVHVYVIPTTLSFCSLSRFENKIDLVHVCVIPTMYVDIMRVLKRATPRHRERYLYGTDLFFLLSPYPVHIHLGRDDSITGKIFLKTS